MVGKGYSIPKYNHVLGIMGTMIFLEERKGNTNIATRLRSLRKLVEEDRSCETLYQYILNTKKGNKVTDTTYRLLSEYLVQIPVEHKGLNNWAKTFKNF